jgi:hypothetical protein
MTHSSSFYCSVFSYIESSDGVLIILFRVLGVANAYCFLWFLQCRWLLLWHKLFLFVNMQCRCNIEAFVAEICTRKKSYKKGHSKFRNRFHGVSFPFKWAMFWWVNKFFTTGFLLKKKQEHMWHILSEETSDDDDICSEACPRKFKTVVPRNQCIEVICNCSFKLFCLKWYKITVAQKLWKPIVLWEYGIVTDAVKQCLVVSWNSADLFYGWDYVNYRINNENDKYWLADNPCIEDDFKWIMRLGLSAISRQELEPLFNNLFTTFQACPRVEESHFQHLL